MDEPLYSCFVALAHVRKEDKEEKEKGGRGHPSFILHNNLPAAFASSLTEWRGWNLLCLCIGL